MCDWRQHGTGCTYIILFQCILKFRSDIRNNHQLVILYWIKPLVESAGGGGWVSLLIVHKQGQEAAMMEKKWVLAGRSRELLLQAHRMSRRASGSPWKGRAQQPWLTVICWGQPLPEVTATVQKLLISLFVYHSSLPHRQTCFYSILISKEQEEPNAAMNAVL